MVFCWMCGALDFTSNQKLKIVEEFFFLETIQLLQQPQFSKQTLPLVNFFLQFQNFKIWKVFVAIEGRRKPNCKKKKRKKLFFKKQNCGFWNRNSKTFFVSFFLPLQMMLWQSPRWQYVKSTQWEKWLGNFSSVPTNRLGCRKWQMEPQSLRRLCFTNVWQQLVLV